MVYIPAPEDKRRKWEAFETETLRAKVRELLDAKGIEGDVSRSSRGQLITILVVEGSDED